MSNFGVNVAVLDEEGRILFIQREDCGAWGLPGGKVEAQETVTSAGVREVYEETGIEVVLTRLVGVYETPRWQSEHRILFAARPTGGSLRPCPIETLNVCFVSPQELPEPFLWWHRQMVLDAVNGVGGGVVWVQNLEWPATYRDMPRQQVYELVERRPDILQGMMVEWCREIGEGDQILELGDQI